MERSTTIACHDHTTEILALTQVVLFPGGMDAKSLKILIFRWTLQDFHVAILTFWRPLPPAKYCNSDVHNKCIHTHVLHVGVKKKTFAIFHL